MWAHTVPVPHSCRSDRPRRLAGSDLDGSISVWDWFSHHPQRSWRDKLFLSGIPPEFWGYRQLLWVSRLWTWLYRWWLPQESCPFYAFEWVHCLRFERGWSLGIRSCTMFIFSETLPFQRGGTYWGYGRCWGILWHSNFCARLGWIGWFLLPWTLFPFRRWWECSSRSSWIEFVFWLWSYLRNPSTSQSYCCILCF